ncbi:MAG TPA: DUF2189 domain-containing protein [Burkholderiales bacterium]|nr:DUF2189 domain-containing protein [Burkholderiales bacterium]
MQAPVDRIDSLSPLPHIRHVEASRPLLWLARGWDDLRHNAGPSLAHGFLLAALGWLILFAFSTHIDLVAAAISGFLLVGPVFGAAFYELSRLRAAGKPATFDASLDGATFHARALVTLGLILAALAIAWVLVSGVLFERAFGGNLPAITESPWRTVLDWDARFYATYLATGAIFAVVAFVISAVSAPLIFDGKQNTRTAIQTSVRTVALNPAAMSLWALIIAVLVAIGFATFLLGLIVVLPLLGHGTWHAYKDLIE